MSTGVVALLVAVVGVLGTLLAPVTTAWVSARTRRQEFEFQQSADKVNRQVEDAKENVERRRTIYVALNSVARRYRLQMMDELRAIQAGTLLESDDPTEGVRAEFQSTYAEAQMLVPDSVLGPSRAVRVALAEARKMMDALRGGSSYTPEDWQEAHAFLLRLWDVMGEMLVAMRQDLGVTGAPEH
ncbi:hypothetical protein ACWCWD_22195 [Streptomyces sp. NPDC001493]